MFHEYVEKNLAKSRILLQKGFQPFVTGVAYYCRAANYSLVVGQWQQKKTIALENLSGQSLKVIAAAFRACLLLCLSSTTQFKLHCTLNYSQCFWFPDKLVLYAYYCLETETLSLCIMLFLLARFPLPQFLAYVQFHQCKFHVTQFFFQEPKYMQCGEFSTVNLRVLTCVYNFFPKGHSE